MSTSYTITITDNELKVLGSVINPVLPGNKQWAEDALKNRARIATNQIQQNLYKHCTQNGISIGVGVTAQIDQAFALGIASTITEPSKSEE